jgi:RNA polymerase sigma factor for flagellar operon FliA
MDPEVAALVTHGVDVVPKVVASLSAHFPLHVERAELVRAGMVGLVEVAHRFDATRGIPFERFAASRIRGAVLDALRADDWVPRSLRMAARRIEMVETSLSVRYGRKPTDAELAAESGSSLERVNEVRALRERSALFSLDLTDVREQAAHHPIETVAASEQRDDFDQLERSELLGYLRDAINELPDRQRQIILGHFLDGRSTAELASELGVTRSRVSQLRTVALHELRRSISGHYDRVENERPMTNQPTGSARSAVSA